MSMCPAQRRLPRAFAVVLGAGLLAALPAPARAQSFVNFESGLVRPLALSADGARLFAVNAPDNRLEIFDVVGSTLVHAQSLSTGLEPVAVAVRNASEVWVVNHLSDSVSIVDVASVPARVVRTILTCDEPRDIVFAGPGGNRAFITTARRGQNCPVPANLTTPGTPRAIVQVFDATNLGASLGGTPIGNVALFGDTPRALATDGSTVYAAVFHSGNQTVPVPETAVCNGGAAAAPCFASGLSMPGGLPAPNRNQQNILGPEVGLIVKFNVATGRWEDELGRNWSNAVRFDLPDLDVFAIDAASLNEVDNWASVGTVLFNMAVNPVSGKVYVSNTDARNEVRFEGPGITHTTVNGHLHEARITVLDGASVFARHLNKHIDYDQLLAPSSTKDRSLATPLGMAISSDGQTLYVAAFGSSKVGIFKTTELENNSFVPNAANQVELAGGGPAGVVLDESRKRLYVLTRFDSSISVVDTQKKKEIDHLPLRYTPEPEEVLRGRRFLYDARESSSNGEASCSSCHIFGDMDSLSWDLGNPDDDVLNNPLPFRIGPLPPVPNGDPDFHPLKGPMTTQTLRGMDGHGSMHWRGDRTGGNDPDSNDFDEFRAFEKFNPAFPGLLGRATVLPADEMADFADFILTVLPPPNPIRALDNSLNATQQSGRNFYFGPISDTLFNCNGCHALNPAQGFFGTDGFATFEGETQMFKIPHLRNVYQKVGMFGVLGTPPQGPQVRGTGILHDGAVDTVFNFLNAGVFQLTNTQRQQVEQFIFAFDSNLAPIVGQQITLTATNAGTVNPRINLLLQRDAVGECDLVVKGVIAGEERGGVATTGGNFQMDRNGDVRTDAAVRALAAIAGQELTYTCVPPGSGGRIGIDRDEDGFFDRDEIDLGLDPADPGSFPGAPVRIRASSLKLRDDGAQLDPSRRRLSFRSAPYRGTPSGVVVPAFGSASDPTVVGATLQVYQVGGATDEIVTLNLPAGSWSQAGNPIHPGYRYRDPQGLAGPITSAVLRNGRLVIRGRGAALFSLVDAPQSEMAVRLDLGGSLTWCAAAPARSPAVSFDNQARFEGVKNSPPPALCPGLPGPYGSPSHAFLGLPTGLLD